MATRRPRLSVFQDARFAGKQKFKDHITGEVLNSHKIYERVNAGQYTAYHVQHLDLSASQGRCSAG